MQKVLLKKQLGEFISNLMRNYEVIAPVKEGVSKFKKIEGPDEIYLDEITLAPAKQFFLPENEVLFEFKNNKTTKAKETRKKRIIFGLRKCDLNAILILDKVM